MRLLILFFVLLLGGKEKVDPPKPSFDVRGMTMVAPHQPIDIEPLHKIRHTNSNWVALVPYAFQRGEDCVVQYNSNGRWWGENIEGIRGSVDLAKRAGLKIMLKPQIYIHGKWTGDIECNSDSYWKSWEESYTKFIMQFASIAQEKEVELLCFGTELKNPIKERPAYFVQLIKDIRKIYKGQLTYAANWDDYDMVKFWKELDFIGINAYCPLSEKETPTVAELTTKWKPYMKNMEKFSKKFGKKILFTEYGYLPINGSTLKPWEVPHQLEKYDLNEMVQANAFEGLFSCLSTKSWWAGGFIWKWFPISGNGRDGKPHKDFTPQDKMAQKVIERWYCR